MLVNVIQLILLLCTPVLSINWTYNPGCGDDTMCGRANMLHVAARHNQYLWSTESGLSGIVFSGANNLSVNWTLYHQNERSVSVVTPCTFGFTLRNLYLENATHHNQTIDLTVPAIRWRPINITNTTSSGSELHFSYSNPFMSVQVSLSEKDGRMEKNPRLKYNENNTLVDIMVNLTKVPGVWVSNPSLGRIELEVAPSNYTALEHTRSFDDEAAPSLFRYDILHSRQGSVSGNTVYALWRPVVYTDTDRTIISSLNTKDITNSTVSHSPALLTKYYNNTADIATLQLAITPPDGEKYLSDSLYWTIAMGVGEPQKETLSVLGSVLTLLIIGLPSAALILGVTFMVYKRRSSHPGQGYRAI